MEIECKLVPPLKPEDRVSLTLDLSKEEALWLKQLVGSITGTGPIRDRFNELYSTLDGVVKGSAQAFQGSVHIRS